MKKQVFKVNQTESAINKMLEAGWNISNIFTTQFLRYYDVVYKFENPKEFEYKVITNFADLESLGTEGFELCNIDKSDGFTKYIFRKEKL